VELTAHLSEQKTHGHCQVPTTTTHLLQAFLQTTNLAINPQLALKLWSAWKLSSVKQHKTLSLSDERLYFHIGKSKKEIKRDL